MVKVSADIDWGGNSIPQDIDIEDQPEGGANALNVNRSVTLSLTVYFGNQGFSISTYKLTSCVSCT